METQVKLSAAIMAVPERSEAARKLCEQLANQGLYARIIFDSKRVEWDTGKRALLSYDDDADYHIVLQDDAIIGDNFVANAIRAIQEVPVRTLISFYVGTQRPYKISVKEAADKARQRGGSWLTFNTLLWGVGIAVPTEDIPSIAYANSSIFAYDRRVGQFYKAIGRSVYYTFPSIVDHDDEVPSALDHTTNGRRVAHRFSVDDETFDGLIFPIGGEY